MSGTERIGTVTDVAGNTVYVDPDWDHVLDQLRDEFDWNPDDDQHEIPESAVTAVQNSQVRIRDDMV